MSNNPENKPPVVPDGYKVVQDGKHWFIIPEDQTPGQPVANEVPA